ncbi:MAG TPA: cation:proton antiporter, partial [Chloroflexota bacterium]|nr:cation:proton antiporter [Chloroflexota bacterium]
MEATLVAQLVGLLLVAFVVGLIASRLFVPYTVALLVVGIAIGFTHLLDGISLTADTILLVFLPALLFESAINLDLQQLRAATLPIALLAVVGVGVTIAIIGGLFAVSTDLPIMLCILLASTLSATDPVSVLAIFRRIGVPKRLEMVIEGESLFNDGTALVAFQITLAAVQAPASASIGQGLVQFVFVVAGGLLLGAVAGFAISHLLAVTQDHLFEMGISTVLAYGSYLAGQLLHVSPVITVVVAGVIVGNYGRQVGLSDRAKVVLNDIWEYL